MEQVLNNPCCLSLVSICVQPMWMAPEIIMGRKYTEKVSRGMGARCHSVLFCMLSSPSCFLHACLTVLPNAVLPSCQADVYAFGIILWEILTRLEPYEDKEPMQIVVEVVNDNLRPTLPPPFCDSPLVPLMKACWGENPEQRPGFEKILERLLEIDAKIPADDNSVAGIPGTSRPVNKHAVAHAQAAVLGAVH
jgi:serine/threonine protein kinase